MNSKTEHISTRLRGERARLGISQAEFCAAGGVSKSTQVAYENGQRVPDLDYLTGVSALGVDPVFVVTGRPSKEFAAKNFDWDLHNEIVIAIAEFQAEHAITIPPTKLADLIHHLFEEFTAAGSIEPETLARVLRLVA